VAPQPTPTRGEPAITRVTVDGDPADWAGYDVLLTDPAGDTQAEGFDIASVRAFANDSYLYVLVETHGPRGEYAQLDLDIAAGGRTFVVSLKPEEGGGANLGETTSGQFVFRGDVQGSVTAAGQAVEFKMPLAPLESSVGLTLNNVRPMAGECCEEDWQPLDEIRLVQVPPLDEVEPAAVGDQTPQAISVCAETVAPPVPSGTFAPAPVEFAEPGYKSEWFVAPGAFNMPKAVFLAPSGDIMVLGTRNFALFRVAEDGRTHRMAEVNGTEGDVDGQGNVYLHSASDGTVTRVTPRGETSLVVRSPDLETSCDSGFGFGPDGHLYLARNLCDFGQIEMADMYRITVQGQVSRVAQAIPALIALRTAPDGRFLAGAQGEEVYALSLVDYSRTELGRVPSRASIATGGLAADAAGNIYVSTGTRSSSGELYRLDSQHESYLVAEIPGNGLSGIQWLAGSGEILGVQLQLGSLVAVTADGTLREIVPGNGLITPRGLAVSPCGELAVSNEDGGAMALIDPAGRVHKWFDYNSFTSPVSYLAFAPDGTLYATEGAPGLPERVVVVRAGTQVAVPLCDAARPAGIARRSDGTLLFAETIEDRIMQLRPDGSPEVFAEGLLRPTALGLGSAGSLYAVVGTGGRPLEEYHMPEAGDTLLRFDAQGAATQVATWPRLAGLAVGPAGDIYAATGWDGGIVRIGADGTVTPLAEGLQEVTDVAFDLVGNLYASDTVLNGIVRIAGFPQGTLRGTVVDADGLPISGARVQVLAVDPIVVGQVVQTGEDGRFALPAAPRSYTVNVTGEGLGPWTRDAIEVLADQETALEIQLQE
jgi:sugar lactone lactonase YvrE